METIIDYKITDFFALENENVINDYLPVLELLKPITEVNDPVHTQFGNVKIKPVKSLNYGRVVTLKNLMIEGSTEAIIKVVSIVTGLDRDNVLLFTIIPFYSILNGISAQLIELNNMEQNELVGDYNEDIEMIEAKANERMSKFSVLNIIDSLAAGDVTKWKEIEELPYMVVFTKLMMEKTKGEIMRDVRAIQQRRNKN